MPHSKIKVIHAVWDKRNLGVDCKEVIINNSNSISDIQKIKDILSTTEYVVVKIPVNCFEISSYLSELGFIFVEGSINFELKLNNAQLLPLQVRLNNSVKYEEMDESDLHKLYSEIEQGLFTTDRILIDNYFSKKQAAHRYINWISDEINKEAQVFKIVYKQEAIGFFTFKSTNEGIYYPFLAGLFKKYRTSGMGFLTLRKPIDEAIRRNGKMISTYASINNMPVIRAHTQQGFSISNIQYVYIKHNK